VGVDYPRYRGDVHRCDSLNRTRMYSSVVLNGTGVCRTTNSNASQHRMAKLGLQAAGVAWLSSLLKDGKEANLLRAQVAKNSLEATNEAAQDPTEVFQRDDTKADHLTALSRNIHVCYRSDCAYNYDGKSASGSRFWAQQ
jgi:hypothetical protein